MMIRPSRVALALILLMAAIVAASAHDGGDPLSVWYRSLETPDGGSCCNMTDCRPVEARLTDQGWQITTETGWRDVPPDRVLKRDNMDGRPVACIWGGEIRCFVPPAAT